MDRRSLLQVLILGGAGTALGLGQSSFQQAIASGTSPIWGYVGENGPDRWGDLSPDYRVCALGQQQSPIDLTESMAAAICPFTLDYPPGPLHLVNNGRTVQVIGTPGSTLTLNGQIYTLQQFHFHHPGEHTVGGSVFPMEIHFVHLSERGDIVVLGLFLQEGEDNATLHPIWDALPTQAGEVVERPHSMIDAIALLPEDRASFQYSGSLTTPPCSEMVTWIVLQTPRTLSRSQLDRFSALFANNARPVQPLHRRALQNA